MKNVISLFSLLVLISLFVSCGKDADNEKFIGKFIGEVTCPTEDGYPTTIDISVKDNSDTRVNLAMDTDGDLVSMTGSVSGNNIVIDKVEVEEDTFLTGTGSLSGNVLSVSFTVTYGSFTEVCIFSGTK